MVNQCQPKHYGIVMVQIAYSKKQADKEEAQMMGIPDEVIEAEVQKRMSCAKAERLSRRQQQIEYLVANAF